MNGKIKNFIKRMLAGLVIGIGGIIPGVSGGILAVSMGLYKPMLDAIGGFFKSPKKSFLFLFPLVIGGAVGLLSMSNAVEWALENYEIPVMCLFFGLVAGGIPSLIKEANSQGGFKKKYIFSALIGAAFIGLLSLAERSLTGTEALPFNYLTAMIIGGILAVGTVIPGISTSFILIFLGLYKPFLSCVNTSTSVSLIFSAISGNQAAAAEWGGAIVHLLFTALGFAAVALILILFVRKMLERYHGYAYYAILGFLVMSMLLIFPNGFIAGLLLSAGFMLALLIDTIMAKKE